MINTRIIHHEFSYSNPGTLVEALELSNEPGSMVLAGGTDLINRLKLETVAPSRIINLAGIRELWDFSCDDGLKIGAMVPMREVESCRTVQKQYHGLYEALSCVGGWQIRNMATIAGNIANASPAADTSPILMVCSAECEVLSMDSSKSVVSRIVPVAEIFTGPGKTNLADNEIITTILVPPIGLDTGTAFERSSRVKLDVAKASAAVWLVRDGDRCADLAVAVGSVGPVPLRAHTVEDMIKQAVMDKKRIEEAAEGIVHDIKPIDDVRSTRKYRNHIMKVLVRDALLSAWMRSGGGDLK